MLTEAKVKATWFITNASPFLEILRANPLFELAIHPNFDVDSTQGSSIDEVLNRLKAIVPDAVTVRTHKLIQSTPILLKFQHYGLENDVSLLLYRTPHIQPHYLEHFRLFRFPFFWEDDIQMCEAGDWTLRSLVAPRGLKIFNFHPIHVFLNSSSMEQYKAVKAIDRMSALQEQRLRQYVNRTGSGVKTFFQDLLHGLRHQKTFTISDLRRL